MCHFLNSSTWLCVLKAEVVVTTDSCSVLSLNYWFWWLLTVAQFWALTTDFGHHDYRKAMLGVNRSVEGSEQRWTCDAASCRIASQTLYQLSYSGPWIDCSKVLSGRERSMATSDLCCILGDYTTQYHIIWFTVLSSSYLIAWASTSSDCTWHVMGRPSSGRSMWPSRTLWLWTPLSIAWPAVTCWTSRGCVGASRPLSMTTGGCVSLPTQTAKLLRLSYSNKDMPHRL